MPPEATDPWQVALAALSRRELTSAEVRRKLDRKKIAKESAERVITRLLERGYVDDRSVAYNHARLRAEQGRRGPRRVRSEMIARGLSAGLVDEAIRESFPASDEAASLVRAARKLCGPSGPPADKAGRERLARRLMRAGFSPGSVLDWLRRAGDDEEDHDDIS